MLSVSSTTWLCQGIVYLTASSANALKSRSFLLVDLNGWKGSAGGGVSCNVFHRAGDGILRMMVGISS